MDQHEEDILLWPDGTHCFRHELEQMDHMSDDYEVVLFCSPRWHNLAQGLGDEA